MKTNQNQAVALKRFFWLQTRSHGKAQTGESIRKIVKEAHPGVINPEPFFNISFFPEEHFGGIFTKHHFIFIPTTLERIASNLC